MTRRIDPVLVEKAYELLSAREPDREDVEAALRVVFDELGLQEERSIMTGYFSSERYVLEDGETHAQNHELEVRFVSPWRLVEQGDADGD